MADGEKKTVSDFDSDRVDEIAADMVSMTPEFEDVIIREWIPRVYAGLLRGVAKLPREYREQVFAEQGRACWDWGKIFLGLGEGMGWEGFKEAVEKIPAPLGPYKFTELGNDMCLWTYKLPKGKDGRAVCWCPMVRVGVLPEKAGRAAGDEHGFPELCQGCATAFMTQSIEECAGRKVARFDTICSVQTSQDPDIEEDRWVVHFKPKAHSRPYTEE